MFASVEREDVQPTCPYYFGAGTCNAGCWEEPRCITDEPLDGWKPPQINAPNPILIMLRYTWDEEREEHENDFRLAADRVLMSCVEEAEAAHLYTRAEQDHARRVITRLLAE